VGILICNYKIPVCNNKEGAATVQLHISDYVPFQFIHSTVININSRIVGPHCHPNPIQTYLPFDCKQYLAAITERRVSHSVPPSLSQFNFFGVKLNSFKCKPWLQAHTETNNVKDLSLTGNFLTNAIVKEDICTLRSPVSELPKMSHKRNKIIILRVQFPMFTVVRDDNS